MTIFAGRVVTSINNDFNFINSPSIAYPNSSDTFSFFEVQALAQDRVFIEDPTKVSDNPGIKVGRYVNTATKFITEFTPEGFFKMTFGGGSGGKNVSSGDKFGGCNPEGTT